MKVGDLVKTWYTSEHKLVGIIVKVAELDGHSTMFLVEWGHGKYWAPVEDLVLINESR